jgi:hypothetical protein
MDVLELPSMASLPLDLALPSPWDSDRAMAEAVFGPFSGDAGARRWGPSGCVIMQAPCADPHDGCRAPQTALLRQICLPALRRDPRIQASTAAETAT